MFRCIRLLAMLLLVLPAGCASVHLAGDTPAGDRSLDQARSDAACSERLWRALGSPPAIRVECRDGTVVLRGRVTSARSRQALVDYVQRQPGVNTVVDRLEMR